MLLPNGEFKVLEFNCRFGDPETQVILPLLETPLEDLLTACAEQRLSDLQPITWKAGAAACVVLAAGGYPGSYQRGQVITGISEAEAMGAIGFHAGTKLQQQLVTDGGRVLGITGLGETFERASALAYAASNCIRFEGMYYRRDIGHRIKSVVSF
jgi:phosphoribosylamine--glycine ligase